MCEQGVRDSKSGSFIRNEEEGLDSETPPFLRSFRNPRARKHQHGSKGFAALNTHSDDALCF